MAFIKLIDKESKIVKDTHERSHDINSLRPLPRYVEEDGKIFMFLHYEAKVAVYREYCNA